MRSGVLRVAFDPAASVAAPVSGVRFGTGTSGPIAVRLFRLAGTRVVVLTDPSPAQLIVARVAAAGTPVQVVTSRPQMWWPLLEHSRELHTIGAVEMRHAVGGPALTVADRSGPGRGAAEVGAWQCRLDVRDDWVVGELSALARVDLAVFGPVPADLTDRVAGAFGLPGAAARGLAALDRNSFALVRRGRIEYVASDATPAEQQLLARYESSSPEDFGPVTRFGRS